MNELESTINTNNKNLICFFIIMSTPTVQSITSGFPDELTPLPELTQTANSNTGFFSNITWQTWLIVILILALIGINVFAYLAKGTQELAIILDPIFKLFGYSVLETTKQTITTTATGTTAGINTVADTSVDTIDTVEQAAGAPTTNSNMSGAVPNGQLAVSSQSGVPVKQEIQMANKEASLEQWQQDSLEAALSNAAQTANEVQPSDSTITIGKSGWCYIGTDLGVRTCSQIGVNDMCMSGDIFPSQEICMNPNLRA